MATSKNLTTVPSNTHPHQFRNVPKIQDFHLVWLYIRTNKLDDNNFDIPITYLTQIFGTINTFIDIDECLDFITDVQEKAFMIISGEINPFLISIFQDVSQVRCIYIFSKQNITYQKWNKVSGTYTDTTSIYKALKQATQDYDRNSISISFAETLDTTANQHLDTLESSFMYTYLLKEILLTIEFKKLHFDEFIRYSHAQCAGDNVNLKKVEKIEKEYHQHEPIWWYTYERFFYSMLNKALRKLETNLIVKMGFFVRNLHESIAKLHSKQYGGQHQSNSFIVYRGQGLPQTDFDQLRTREGGLLAFNNFLSTTLNPEVSRFFAESSVSQPDLVGVHFVIYIHPSISSTPFANISGVAQFPEEEEILFSMHSVFRVDEVKQIDGNNNRLWQVKLTLTGDRDPQLQEVMKSMREETEEFPGWFRLARLVTNLAQFDMAQQLFEMILTRTTNEKGKSMIHHYLGRIKREQGKNIEAITHHEKSLEIGKRTLPANHPYLAHYYTSTGSVYYNMGEYAKALSYYEKGLGILRKILPENHSTMTNIYSNIGAVHTSMGEYSKAVSYFEKALEIKQKTLPANHPDFVVSYNNIAMVYFSMGEYSKAVSFYEKALEISKKTLPANHPNFAAAYGNIGGVYHNMGEYSKAISYYEKALEILQKVLPANHSSLTAFYNNIGEAHRYMGEYAEALSYFGKALEIDQKILSPHHPHLATSYNNIGGVFMIFGEYSKSLTFFGKALEIFEKSFPPNHPTLAISYNNIGLLYKNMREYSKALSYYEKGLEIDRKTLPVNHPDFATSYNNIGMVYFSMGEYSKAVSFYEKALEILQKTLPTNHPHLPTTHNNLREALHLSSQFRNI